MLDPLEMGQPGVITLGKIYGITALFVLCPLGEELQRVAVPLHEGGQGGFHQRRQGGAGKRRRQLSQNRQIGDLVGAFDLHRFNASQIERGGILSGGRFNIPGVEFHERFGKTVDRYVDG